VHKNVFKEVPPSSSNSSGSSNNSSSRSHNDQVTTVEEKSLYVANKHKDVLVTIGMQFPGIFASPLINWFLTSLYCKPCLYKNTNLTLCLKLSNAEVA
jgi:hypothetical protein